jgi:hypothetical protein
MIYRAIDIVLYLPSFLMAFVYWIKRIGGNVSIPILDNIPTPFYVLLTIAMSAYWIARALSILLKSWGEYQEKVQQNEAQKIKNNKLRRNEMVTKESIYASSEQLKMLNDFEERIAKEREELHKKIKL